MSCGACGKDHPVPGDRVAVVREEHGWHDGRLEATVTNTYHFETGRVAYEVRDDRGAYYSCRSTGDIRPV